MGGGKSSSIEGLSRSIFFLAIRQIPITDRLIRTCVKRCSLLNLSNLRIELLVWYVGRVVLQFIKNGTHDTKKVGFAKKYLEYQWSASRTALHTRCYHCSVSCSQFLCVSCTSRLSRVCSGLLINRNVIVQRITPSLSPNVRCVAWWMEVLNGFADPRIRALLCMEVCQLCCVWRIQFACK